MVTVNAWTKCVNAGACTTPSRTTKIDQRYNYGHSKRHAHPVNGVTWYQARIYCKSIGGRLPTEAEWEHAARGSCGHYPGVDCKKAMPIYPWGNAAPTCKLAAMDDKSAGGDGCGTKQSSPVGQRPAGASKFGIYDLSGNLYEWVNDWYSEKYYAVSPKNDPPGPSGGSKKIYRGGAYYVGPPTDGHFLRSSSRKSLSPTTTNLYGIGFRCVREVTD